MYGYTYALFGNSQINLKMERVVLPGRSMRQVPTGKLVHYEQTVRMRWKGNEWPDPGMRRWRRGCSGPRIGSPRWDPMDSARHVIGCHLTQEMKVHNAVDDVGSIS